MSKNSFNAKEVTLENGFRLITIKKETSLVAINLGINIGSIYENINEKGISHFIEHMLFKGTVNRDNETLNQELENLGGEYNAYTDYSTTCFSITALKDEIENAISLLSDMIQNPTFSKKEIEKEREVILSELRSSRDDLEELSFIKMNYSAFEKGPLKYDVIGEERTVGKFKRDDLLKFYNKYYKPSNAVITVVSNYDHELVYDLVKKYFSAWEDEKVTLPDVITEDNKEVYECTYKNDIEQGTVTYLYTFHGLTKKEELHLKVLENKLGSSNNSILFRELREKRGLAYEVYSDMNSEKNIKTIYIFTATSEDKIEEAMSAIEECIDKVINREIKFTEENVNLMRKILKTAIVNMLEDPTDIGSYVLHQALNREGLYQFEKDLEELEHVTEEDIYEVGKKVFRKPSKHVLLPKGE